MAATPIENGTPTTFSIPRLFTTPEVDVFDMVEWGNYDLELKSDITKEVIFQMEQAEFPTTWSEDARLIVAEKYFKMRSGVLEHSLKQLLDRVVSTITTWGMDQGYFPDAEIANVFSDELFYILLNQMGAFNSPVWFNVGLECEQQCSACFILGVQDEMKSITDVVDIEAQIFKRGSGSGLNLSALRSSGEPLSKGGASSGAIGFMAAWDANAGTIKSGGSTRRAACMRVLNDTHPEVYLGPESTDDFIGIKAHEEEVAWALHKQLNRPLKFNHPNSAYINARFQNANNSVSISDNFMLAVEEDSDWFTRYVLTGEVALQFPAKEMFSKIAKATHECGDPGVQFTDTINKWHTCKESGRINSSNPCCFVGDTPIDTSEGRISFEELYQMDRDGQKLPYSFSWDKVDNLPALKPINKVWVAGETTHLIEIETQKGIIARCTPEHHWLLHDGTYIEAQNLKPGMRLRKIGRWSNDERRGSHYINHRVTDYAQNGTVHQARWMWEQVHGPIPDGFDVHHLNEDPADDRLSNLELKDSTQHLSDHSAGVSNPCYLDVPDHVLVDVWDAVEQMPKLTHKNKPEMVTPTRWNRYIRENDLKGKVPIANPVKGIRGMSWSAFTTFIKQARSVVNDKVLEVRAIELDKPVKVYDMEVADTHNFSIATEGVTHTIIVSNSEYLFLDWSACNIASLNVLKFYENSKLMKDEFLHAVRLLIIAQDILINKAYYPDERIEKNSHEFRPLGLGYTNLGGLLMSLGIPYDSEKGRDTAACLTSLMTAQAYLTSSELAKHLKPFEQFEKNKKSMLKVIDFHDALSGDLETVVCDYAEELGMYQARLWTEVKKQGRNHGFRNAQVSLLAPCGTISFLMDARSTGMEPLLGLVVSKSLVGEGEMELTAIDVAEMGLDSLGYNEDEKLTIIQHIHENKTIEGCEVLKHEHLPVFDCSFTAPDGSRCIRPMAHVSMVAAIQPFLSGGISKTVNVHEDCSVEDIESLYLEAWKQGLKSITIYRNNSKGSQPINVTKRMWQRELERMKLPDNVLTWRHKFDIGNHAFYIMMGFYPEGRLGEVFLFSGKEGGLISGLLRGFAKNTSYLLQSGHSLKWMCQKHLFEKFEPMGWSSNKVIGPCDSIIDYAFKYMAFLLLAPEDWSDLGIEPRNMKQLESDSIEFQGYMNAFSMVNLGLKQSNGKGTPNLKISLGVCDRCGGALYPSASCKVCIKCKQTTECS